VYNVGVVTSVVLSYGWKSCMLATCPVFEVDLGPHSEDSSEPMVLKHSNDSSVLRNDGQELAGNEVRDGRR
jgi:hypothetical protein